MNKMTTYNNSLIGHIRLIVGGTIFALALTAIFGSLTSILQWGVSGLLYAALGFLSVTTSAFVLAKWLHGSATHGAIIGFAFAWISTILFQQLLIQKTAQLGPYALFVLFFLSPLPIAGVGFIGGMLGKRFSK